MNQSINVVGCVCIRRTDRGTHQYDVALLKLQEPASLDQRGNINAVCLPSKSRLLPVGSVCLAAGWGRLGRATISFPAHFSVTFCVCFSTVCL